jgi:hypothetical protein
MSARRGHFSNPEKVSPSSPWGPSNKGTVRFEADEGDEEDKLFSPVCARVRERNQICRHLPSQLTDLG